MLDFFVRIPGPVFLVYFSLFAIACIIMARLFLNWLECADKPALPVFTHFKPSAFAYLRGGLPEVVQTAVFGLWQKGVVEISGSGKNSIFQRSSSLPDQLPDPAENAAYAFIESKNEGLSSRTFINNSVLSVKIEQKMKPLLDELQRLHLLRTAKDRSSAWALTWLTVAVIESVGGAKLYLGLTRHRPVGFLVVLLLLSFLAVLLTLTPWNKVSFLGKKYLRDAKRHFSPSLDLLQKNKAPNGFDPAYLLAFSDIAAVSSIAAYSMFREALVSSSSSGGTDWSGGCGGSSDSSSSGSDSSSGCGGGGGCGGCGGGGD